jgi:hypothetical protein
VIKNPTAIPAMTEDITEELVKPNDSTKYTPKTSTDKTIMVRLNLIRELPA